MEALNRKFLGPLGNATPVCQDCIISQVRQHERYERFNVSFRCPLLWRVHRRGPGFLAGTSEGLGPCSRTASSLDNKIVGRIGQLVFGIKVMLVYFSSGMLFMIIW